MLQVERETDQLTCRARMQPLAVGLPTMNLLPIMYAAGHSPFGK